MSDDDTKLGPLERAGWERIEDPHRGWEWTHPDLASSVSLTEALHINAMVLRQRARAERRGVERAASVVDRHVRAVKAVALDLGIDETETAQRMMELKMVAAIIRALEVPEGTQDGQA